MIRVTRSKLPDLPVDRLEAIESKPDVGVYEGCTMGYRCRVCGQADEDIQEVLHEEHCELAGEHGREKYDDLPRVDTPGRSPELSDEHPIDAIVADWTDRSADVWREDVIAFRCGHCSNLDEDVFEIVHDEACELAAGGGLSVEEIVESLGVEVECQ